MGERPKYTLVGTKTIRLLKGNVRVNLHKLGLSNTLNMTPEAKATSEKIGRFLHQRTLLRK